MSKTALAIDEIEKPQSLSHAGRKIEESIYTTAAPEQVWNAWTNPHFLSGWFVDKAEGQPVEGQSITWFFEKLGFSAPMRVLQAIPNQRIILEPPYNERATQLQELSISQEGTLTQVKLTHSGFGFGADWDDEFDGVRSDWYMALRLMRFYLECRYGQTKSNSLVLRAANVDYDKMRFLSTTESGLRNWLTASGSIGDEGTPYSIKLRNGETMSGTVLAKSKRDVSISWNEIGGILEMKVFTFPQIGRMVALHAVSWEMNDEQMAKIEEGLHRAIDLLVETVNRGI